MNQIYLHPNAKPTSKATIHGPISRAEQALGKLLDTSILLPGDLILVSSINPGLVQRSIRKIQSKGGYSLEHARWEHAAMYIGKGVLCEASRKGVGRAMITNYVGSHVIRARRDLSLSESDRWKLAIEALSQQGYSYSYLEIARLLIMSRIGYSDHTNLNKLSKPKMAVICSELYADSYALATRKVIGNIEGKEVTPASLSAERTFNDVQLQWLSINNSQLKR